jgi:hypothetical protein
VIGAQAEARVVISCRRPVAAAGSATMPSTILARPDGGAFPAWRRKYHACSLAVHAGGPAAVLAEHRAGVATAAVAAGEEA